MNCTFGRSAFVFAAAPHQGSKIINVTLMGPDKVRFIVQISEETTLRDVATSKYHLVRRAAKRNGISVIPFTTEVVDGDIVTVESE